MAGIAREWDHVADIFHAGYKLHEAAAEHPLLGRLALHAERLTVAHPVTGARIEFVAPLPKDFTVALKYLRKFAAAGVVVREKD